MPEYIEFTYCDDCMTAHLVEIQRGGRQICHGRHYNPNANPRLYMRRRGRGWEVIEKATRANMAIPLPLDWQIARETIDTLQDW